MLYLETHQDLFAVDFKKYTPVHCISTDCKMGAGIAVPMRKKFGLGGLVTAYTPEQRKHPTCIYYKGVLNLITKDRYFHKPTLQNMKTALTKMGLLMIHHGIGAIAMPKIGSGLDKLSWPEVRVCLHEVFSPFEDVEILVCVK